MRSGRAAPPSAGSGTGWGAIRIGNLLGLGRVRVRGRRLDLGAYDPAGGWASGAYGSGPAAGPRARTDPGRRLGLGRVKRGCDRFNLCGVVLGFGLLDRAPPPPAPAQGAVRARPAEPPRGPPPAPSGPAACGPEQRARSAAARPRRARPRRPAASSSSGAACAGRIGLDLRGSVNAGDRPDDAVGQARIGVGLAARGHRLHSRADHGQRGRQRNEAGRTARRSSPLAP